MKEIKNVLLILLMSVCSLLLVDVMTVKAAPGVNFSNRNPVCDPSEDLKLGEKTTCYILGKGTVTVPEGDNADQQGLTHGFVVRMYTTDGLILDDIKTYIDGTAAIATTASAESDTPISFPIGNTKVDFTCTFKNLAAEDAAYQFEAGDVYRCAIFYSDNEKPQITVKSAEPTTDIQGITGKDNGTMVIGKVIAHIDENKKGETSCGELCVYAKEIKTINDYKDGLQGSENYLCTEVHFKDDSGTSPGGPNTGAFASYALLAAGALIAIGAVTIAKRNNKFYKV